MIRLNRIMISALCLSMIFSENRFPPIGSEPEGMLFRIMLACRRDHLVEVSSNIKECGLVRAYRQNSRRGSSDRQNSHSSPTLWTSLGARRRDPERKLMSPPPVLTTPTPCSSRLQRQ